MISQRFEVGLNKAEAEASAFTHDPDVCGDDDDDDDDKNDDDNENTERSCI